MRYDRGDGVNIKGVWLPGDPEYVRNPGGHIIVDGQDIAMTIQCVHCNCQWVPIRGSGKTRGFCLNCKGPICGKQECIGTCLPWEKKLDNDDKLRKGHFIAIQSP